MVLVIRQLNYWWEGYYDQNYLYLVDLKKPELSKGLFWQVMF